MHTTGGLLLDDEMDTEQTDERPKDREYVVVVRVGKLGTKAAQSQELRFPVTAQSPELAIRAIMSDSMVAMCAQGYCEPIAVSISGRRRKFLGTCCKCGGCVLEGKRRTESRTGLLCEDCGSDCVPPVNDFWMGDE